MEWKKFSEEKPIKEKPVLAYWKEDKIEGAVFTSLDGDEYWYFLQDGDSCPKDPTHWMEMPKPPKT